MAGGREWDLHTQSGSWNWRQAPRQRKKTWSRDSCPTTCTHFRDASHPAEGPNDTEEINVYLTSKKLLSIRGTRRVESENDWGKTVGIFFPFRKVKVQELQKFIRNRWHLRRQGYDWQTHSWGACKASHHLETPRNTNILLQRLPDHNPA